MRADGISWPRLRPWLLLAVLTVPATLLLLELQVPCAALFAGLAAAAVLALLGSAPDAVPRAAMGGAQAVVGVVIGLLAQGPTLVAVAGDWLPVLLVALGTLVVSMATGLLMGAARGVTPLSGMLALTAGGAAGLVAITRDLGGDERLVAVVQYLRVGIITASMPLVAALAFGVGGGGNPITTSGSAPWYLGLALVAVCCVIGLPPARLLRLPAGSLLGPMIVAIVLSLTGMTFGAAPADLLVEIAYAVVGWQAGVRFTRDSLRTVARILPLATVLIVVIVAVCAALGQLLAQLTGVTPLEGYLATTPGGVYAVLAIAVATGSNATFVVAVQVLRVIVMLVLAPLLARAVGRRWPRGTPESDPG